MLFISRLTNLLGLLNGLVTLAAFPSCAAGCLFVLSVSLMICFDGRPLFRDAGLDIDKPVFVTTCICLAGFALHATMFLRFGGRPLGRVTRLITDDGPDVCSASVSLCLGGRPLPLGAGTDTVRSSGLVDFGCISFCCMQRLLCEVSVWCFLVGGICLGDGVSLSSSSPVDISLRGGQPTRFFVEVACTSEFSSFRCLGGQPTFCITVEEFLSFT